MPSNIPHIQTYKFGNIKHYQARISHNAVNYFKIVSVFLKNRFVNFTMASFGNFSKSLHTFFLTLKLESNSSKTTHMFKTLNRVEDSV